MRPPRPQLSLDQRQQDQPSQDGRAADETIGTPNGADSPDIDAPAAATTSNESQSDSPSVAAQDGTTGTPGTAATGSPTSRGLVSVGLLIALAMIGGLAIMAIRKRLLDQGSADGDPGSLLDDMRQSLREGTITQAEFDAARRSMAVSVRAEMNAQTSTGAGVGGGKKLGGGPPKRSP